MGFLIKPKKGGAYHGNGSTPGNQVVNAGVAVGNTIARDPSTLRAQTVTPLPAVSSMVVHGVSFNLGSGEQTRIAPVAIGSTVAKTPTVTGSGGSSFNPTTGAGIMGTNGAVPYAFDAASLYVSDTDWKNKKVWYGLGAATPSGPFAMGGKTGDNAFPTSLYGDGRFPDNVGRVASPDASYGPNFNEPCFEWLIPGGSPNGPAGTAILRIYPGVTSGVYQTILMTRRAYCTVPQFTPAGNGNPTYNAGSASSYKKGPFNGYATGGRGGVITDYDVPSNIILSNSLSGSAGFTEIIGATSGPASFRDGYLYTTAEVLEQFIVGGVVYSANTYYEKKDGDTNWTQLTPRIVGYSVLTSRVPVVSFTVMHENYNESRATILKCWSTHFAAFNIDQDSQSADPAGFLAYFAGVTPADPVSVIVNSASSTNMSLKVGIGRSNGYFRAKVDGSFITGQDYLIKQNESEVIVTDFATPTLGTATMPLSGLVLLPGSHTVQVYALNKNGTVLSASGPSKTFTV